MGAFDPYRSDSLRQRTQQPQQPPSWWDQGQVNRWYTEYLGRPEQNPDAGFNGNYEPDGWQRATSMENMRQALYTSPEAQAYRQRKANELTQTPSQPTSPVNANGTPSTQPQAGVSGFQAREIPPYQGFNYNVQTPQAYQAGQLPQQAFGQEQNSQMQLVRQILSSPQTLGPQAVAMMKEKEKEQALSMQEQLLGDMQLDATRRGINVMPLQQRAAQDLISHLTGAYRDIDLAAAQTNRQNELDAVGMADSVFGNRQSRDLGMFLAGEQLKQAESDSAFRNAGLDLSIQQAQQQDMLNRWQSQAAGVENFNSTGLQNAGMQLSQMLAERQLAEQMRQFNAQQQNQLMLQAFLSNQWRPLF